MFQNVQWTSWPNPNGVFADWNPNLSCDPESVAAWEARASIAKYSDFQQAIADGYQQATPYLSNPEQGAQGFHYRNAALLDGVVDHTKPELLMYIPSEDGTMRLVAAEYAVPNSVEPVPSLFGQTFHPAPPGVPLLVLHAWVWEPNPNGVFADWNPDLSCPSLGAAIDAMVHPMSPALASRVTGKPELASGADDVLARLDEANVQQAIIQSLGFFSALVKDDAGVSAEVDFAAAEVARSPNRLMGFCGINPLFAGALAEIDRCLGLTGMVGIKLNPPFSGMDLADEDHAAALSAVFDKAEEHDAPVQFHTRSPRDKPLDANAFANLTRIIAGHPDVRVSHSHCGGVIDEHTSGQWLQSLRRKWSSFSVATLRRPGWKGNNPDQGTESPAAQVRRDAGRKHRKRGLPGDAVFKISRQQGSTLMCKEGEPGTALLRAEFHSEMQRDGGLPGRQCHPRRYHRPTDYSPPCGGRNLPTIHG